MKHLNTFTILFLGMLFLGCVAYPSKSSKKKKITSSFQRQQPLTAKQKQHWYFKDIYTDSIPGISLDKAYHFLKTKKIKDTVIVALIDTELDISQKELKSQIWQNKNEIPNNGIDDDQNGYIDDMHGWNFVRT